MEPIAWLALVPAIRASMDCVLAIVGLICQVISVLLVTPDAVSVLRPLPAQPVTVLLSLSVTSVVRSNAQLVTQLLAPHAETVSSFQTVNAPVATLGVPAVHP